MKYQVKKTGSSFLPWVVEDDSGGVAWCGSWEEAIEIAREYASETTVCLVKPDKFFREHHFSPERGHYECDIAKFGEVEASKAECGFQRSRIRLGDSEFASVNEARQTAVQLLSACAWVMRTTVTGKFF